MGAVEQIEEQLRLLPPDKQREVLDFVTFLHQQMGAAQHQGGRQVLSQHPAFGSWRARKIDPLDYQHMLRSEWDNGS